MNGAPAAAVKKQARKCTACLAEPADHSAQHPVHADIRLPDLQDPTTLTSLNGNRDVLSYHSQCLRRAYKVGDCINFTLVNVWAAVSFPPDSPILGALKAVRIVMKTWPADMKKHILYTFKVQDIDPGKHVTIRISYLTELVVMGHVLPHTKLSQPLLRLGVSVQLSDLRGLRGSETSLPTALPNLNQKVSDFDEKEALPLPVKLLDAVQAEHRDVFLKDGSSTHMYASPPAEFLSRALQSQAWLRVPLKKYQIFTVAWMMWREAHGYLDQVMGFSSDTRTFAMQMRDAYMSFTPSPRVFTTGGMVAEEMGMGKTIETLAVILEDNFLRGEVDTMPQAAESVQAARTFSEKFSDRLRQPSRALVIGPPRMNRRVGGGTLVITPVTLCSQWVAEIKERAKQAPTVALHYGPKRAANFHKTQLADVVITTYETVSADMRQQHKAKASCLAGMSWMCQGNVFVKRLKVMPTSVALGQVVTLAGSGYVWLVDAIHDDGAVDLWCKRTTAYAFSLDTCQENDLTDWCRGILLGSAGVETMTRWFPVGMSHTLYQLASCDEVHKSGNLSKCPSCGHNCSNVLEAYALLEAASPLHGVQWRRIVIDESHKLALRTQLCTDVQTLVAERKWCLTGTPMQKQNATDLYGQLAFLGQSLSAVRSNPYVLLPHFIKDIMIRHVKQDMDVALPGMSTTTLWVTMSPEEAAAYRRHNTATCELLASLTIDEVPQNVILLFSHIYTERVACSIRFEPSTPAETICSSKPPSEPSTECPVCLEVVPCVNGFPCRHVTCRECLCTLLEAGQTTCPVCRIAGVGADMWAAARKADKLSKTAKSSAGDRREMQNQTKFSHLLTYLLSSTVPTIIFTQFNATLKCLRAVLLEQGFHISTLSGDMTEGQRAAAVKSFLQTVEGSILIITLRAASLGLNLTHAKRAIFVDAPWNAGMEAQAFARIHRLGQTSKVEVAFLMYANTIETRIRENRTRDEHRQETSQQKRHHLLHQLQSLIAYST